MPRMAEAREPWKIWEKIFPAVPVMMGPCLSALQRIVNHVTISDFEKFNRSYRATDDDSIAFCFSFSKFAGSHMQYRKNIFSANTKWNDKKGRPEQTLTGRMDFLYCRNSGDGTQQRNPAND